ncbi:Protochlorophyllide-dependent translocon component 52, chloroplastic, partial [Linum perenne]
DKIFDDPLLEASVNGGTEEYKKFDWFAYWYPVMPVCDLDNRLPHAKTVLGLDLVAWWDRNEGAWKVFDDMCPHRLAPLSVGRIDQWGRLQCMYHGWCFNGGGECKLIPQAPLDGPSERKIMEAGISNWSKACFMPTKADTHVIAFRRWLRRYSGGQINWGGKVQWCSSSNSS